MLHAPVRTEFATTDPEEAQSIVAAAYADNHLRISGSVEGFRLEQAQHDLGDIRFSTVCGTLTTEYAMDPLRFLTIGRVVSGSLRIHADHIERRVGPGDVLLIARPDREYVSTLTDFDVSVVALDLSLLDQVVDEDADPVRWLRLEALPPDRALHFRRTVDYLAQTLLAGDEVAASPLILGAAGRLLAATTLQAFGPEPTAAAFDRADAVPATVRRAVAFCESNPDLDIGVADIARAAHVSVRALQLAFRRHLDTTPMRYLRRVRLDLARADLQAADTASGATVTAIAIRRGYPDLSRFAADYHAAYGEHPHVTLKRLHG